MVPSSASALARSSDRELHHRQCSALPVVYREGPTPCGTTPATDSESAHRKNRRLGAHRDSDDPAVCAASAANATGMHRDRYQLSLLTCRMIQTHLLVRVLLYTGCVTQADRRVTVTPAGLCAHALLSQAAALAHGRSLLSLASDQRLLDSDRPGPGDPGAAPRVRVSAIR